MDCKGQGCKSYRRQASIIFKMGAQIFDQDKLINEQREMIDKLQKELEEKNNETRLRS